MSSEPTAADIAATNVRAFRRARGWTLRQLCDRLAEVGYPMQVSALSKRERTEGQTVQMSVDDLAAFACALGVSAEALLAEPISDPDLAAVAQLVEELGAEIREKEKEVEILGDGIRKLQSELFRNHVSLDALHGRMRSLAESIAERERSETEHLFLGSMLSPETEKLWQQARTVALSGTVTVSTSTTGKLQRQEAHSVALDELADDGGQ